MLGLLRLARHRGSYSARALTTAPTNLVAYWPLDDVGGSVVRDVSGNGRHGAYVGTPTAGTGVGDGRSAAVLPGAATAAIDLYSASLAAAWPTTTGTFACWVKVANAGVWADGTLRYIARFEVGASNHLRISRATGANEIAFQWAAGGTIDTDSWIGLAETGWLHVACTWAAAALNIYIMGVQVGTSTTLGTWAGSLVSTTVTLGAGTNAGAASVWSGSIAHAVLFNAALNRFQIGDLASLPGSRRLIIDGDSRCVALGSTEAPWPPQLLSASTITRWRPGNVAVPSQTVESMNSDFASQIAPHCPGAVAVLFGGVNDGVAGASAATIYDRLKTWWAAARAAGAKVVACTEIDAQNAGADAVSWHSTLYPALNVLIKSDPSLYDALVDLGADARLQDATNLTYFTSDQIHPTTAGYGVIAALVRPVIEAL